MDGVEERVQIEYIDTPVRVSVDFSRLTFGDYLRLRKIQGGGLSDDEAEQMIVDLVTKLTGQDALELPGMAVNAILAELGQRASQGSPSAKN